MARNTEERGGEVSKSLEKELKVGAKIRIGTKYSKDHNETLKGGQVIELIEGEFEEYNGLYDECVQCPSIWNSEEKEFDSIYHLFGNDLENFMDCELIKEPQ